MKFKIGQRVRYTRPERETTGTVIEMYPGYVFEGCRYPAHYAVRVDEKPSWWPYPGTDVFAPSVEDLEAEIQVGEE